MITVPGTTGDGTGGATGGAVTLSRAGGGGRDDNEARAGIEGPGPRESPRRCTFAITAFLVTPPPSCFAT